MPTLLHNKQARAWLGLADSAVATAVLPHVLLLCIFSAGVAADVSPPAVMRSRQGGEDAHVIPSTRPYGHDSSERVRAVAQQQCPYGSRSCSASRRDVPCAATADVRHGDLGDRVPLLTQPGGHERKGTKQGRICSQTKDICPWPQQLFGMISQGQRVRLTDTRLVLHKTSCRVLGCPNVC